MNKHLNSVPAVAVVFIDLEWDAAEWNERKMECSARVQAVRGKIFLEVIPKIIPKIVQKNVPKIEVLRSSSSIRGKIFLEIISQIVTKFVPKTIVPEIVPK